MDNQIFTYETFSKEPPKRGFKLGKIIIIVFALIIAVELILGLKMLLAPISISKKAPLKPLSSAIISLTTTKTNFRVADSVPVGIKISTGGHTSLGTDVILTYDPKVLEASPTSFIKGDIYDDYPAIDSGSGQLRISGVSSVGKPGFNGAGNFGTVNFKAKGAGSPIVSVKFIPQSSSDSNVYGSDNMDILGKVGSVKINIQ